MATIDLERHRDALFEFAERLLGSYTKELKARSGPFDQKEFNDPVWQTIVLQPLEVAILDSPLLQRLRLIRQLGVVHWVYPGATHTRFEHTLGVIHQVYSLISTLNKRSPDPEHPVISTQVTNLMRLIALCHDMGHGVMSHVSENALRNVRQIEDILLDFCDLVQVERAKPSELAAYYLVESPAFRTLLQVASDKNRQYPLPDDPITSIQNAIIGKKILDEIPLLHELINGPFDADKLDYMPRDARMAGVPVVTDIPRLIQKVRAVRVSQEKLPESVARGVRGGLHSYLMTGVALSGGRTLDELMLGRTLLFDKIYRHQKVRAAESMVAALLDNIAQIAPGSPAMLPFKFVDDQLINLDRLMIQELAGGNIAENQADSARVLLDIARRLRERSLFVRSFAFSQHMPLDPYGADERQRAGLDRLIRDARDPQRRGNLVTQLVQEVRHILNLLEREDLLENFPEDTMRSYLWIDPPEAPSHGSEIYNAHLIGPNGEVLRFRDETAEARAWTDAYPLARDLGYIFTAPELSPYVFLAAEKVVRTVFGVRIPLSMATYTKQPEDLIVRLREKLVAKKYYAGAPYDIQPVPDRLLKADIRSRLQRMSDDLRGYAGPSRDSDKDRKGPMLGWERIVDWLRQFEDEDTISTALDTVTRIRMIGRPDIVQSMRQFLQGNQAFRGAFVCPLGEPKDSSAICTYLAGDVQQEYDLKISPLENVLSVESACPILFVEDFVGSGRQPITILESMLGEERSYDLGEIRQPLSEPLRSALRQRRLGFVFAAGMDEGSNAAEGKDGRVGVAGGSGGSNRGEGSACRLPFGGAHTCTRRFPRPMCRNWPRPAQRRRPSSYARMD